MSCRWRDYLLVAGKDVRYRYVGKRNLPCQQRNVLEFPDVVYTGCRFKRVDNLHDLVLELDEYVKKGAN